MNLKISRLVSFILVFLILVASFNLAGIKVFAEVNYSSLTMRDVGTTTFSGFYKWGTKIYAYDSSGYLYKHTGSGMTDADFTKITENKIPVGFDRLTQQNYIPLFNESTGKVFTTGMEFDIATDTYTAGLPCTGYSMPTSNVTLIGQYASKAYYSAWSYSNGFTLIELDMNERKYTSLGALSNSSIIEKINNSMSYSGNTVDGRYFFINVDYTSPRVSGWGNIGVAIVDVVNKTVIDISSFRTGVGANQPHATFLAGVKTDNNTILAYQSKDKKFISLDMSTNTVTTYSNANTINWTNGGESASANYPVIDNNKVFYMNGGKTRSITLVSAPVKPNPPAVSTDDGNNLIVGLTTELEFSYDGTNYTKYNGSNAPDLSGDKTIYVRIATDGSTPASDPVILTFIANQEPAGGEIVSTKQAGSVGVFAKFDAGIIELGQIDGIFKIDPNAADPDNRVKTIVPAKQINESTFPLRFTIKEVNVAADSPKTMILVDPNVRTDIEWKRANKPISETELGAILSFIPSEYLQFEGIKDISAYDINHAGGMVVGVVGSQDSLNILFELTKIGLSQSKADKVKLEIVTSVDFY